MAVKERVDESMSKEESDREEVMDGKKNVGKLVYG